MLLCWLEEPPLLHIDPEYVREWGPRRLAVKSISSAQLWIGQMGGFAQLMPDLNWEIQDMHQDGNTVIVRSRATGTPVAPFFGVDGEGRSFDIMTIDIHELDDGKILRTYHVEDWAGALQQLAGK